MFRHVAPKTILAERFKSIRGEQTRPPAASVIVPVNAQADLETVMAPLTDLSTYVGRHALEVVLVVNNYPADQPPDEQIERYRKMGLTVIATPSCRRPGVLPSLSARVVGLQAAAAEATIHFDADVRIPNATMLLDWYVEQFRRGACAAYTHVGYFDLPDDLSVRLRLLVHIVARWCKRNLLGIPTLRGSNYAVQRTAMLRLWNDSRLVDELNVGPTFQRLVGRVSYSGSPDLVVFTSGRYWHGGWRNVLRYFRYRLGVNMRRLPVRDPKPRA
jgi:hypothetical protein